MAGMKKKGLKTGVDILMTVLLLVLMAHKLVGEEVDSVLTKFRDIRVKRSKI